jgi:hypothetical protein
MRPARPVRAGGAARAAATEVGGPGNRREDRELDDATVVAWLKCSAASCERTQSELVQDFPRAG